MDGTELRQYETKTGSRYDYAFHQEGGGRALMVTDGYEMMQAGKEAGWRTLASWGNAGYDLGDWPFVVFMSRGPVTGPKGDGEPGPFEVMVHVEGDLTFYSFPTNQLRRDGLTYLFVWYAAHGGRSYAEGWNAEDSSTWPADISGPYRYLETEEAA